MKINSRQRRSNRFVKTYAMTTYSGSLYTWGEGRWLIAYRRRVRRLHRRWQKDPARMWQGVKICRPVPCPPFIDFYLEVR